MLPPAKEMLTELPTSLQRRGPVSFTDGPVILVMALEEEASTPRPSMIEAHPEALLIWAKLANDLLETTSLEVSETGRN
ncbi:hypothetical protein SAMN02745225_02337 [Ferrithrix thermotolerans DSM 19514]|uniref:Uncharacterized protein n=2 Tax=Ferrithrix TaxID=643949 RepID=A0A1M4YGV9_9ACTN|nr:hypothetical protein SAMN02745225_02337 [Ferrithrix thermotolerans DSM 19514]